MLIYKIKYYYQTGDSFKTYDDQGELEMAWKSLDNAKEALKRIQEHYVWYVQENRSYYYEKKEEVAEPKWHVGEQYDFTVKVKLDNGNEVKFSAPWCGYFERLYCAEIVSDDPEMRVNFES